MKLNIRFKSGIIVPIQIAVISICLGHFSLINSAGALCEIKNEGILRDIVKYYYKFLDSIEWLSLFFDK